MKISSFSWIEVDTKAFRKNIKLMSSVLSPQSKYMLMVKGNALGNGLIEISKIAGENGVSYLGITSLKEAIILRDNGITTPILLFTEVEPDLIEQVLKYKITPVVYTLSYAKKLSGLAQKQRKIITVHIKIDTGLHRFGIKVNDALQDVIKISRLANIEIEGILTHFADAIYNISSASKQLDLFKDFYEQLRVLNINPKIKHAANSAALVWLKDSHLDMVRFGLATYGLQPSIRKRFPLSIQPVMTWKTKILQIKRIQKGEYVGYGGSFRAKTDMTIAILGVGYADGFRRSPQNYQSVLIKGEKCPVIANVTMNFTMVDVTRLKHIRLSDIVVLIGKQKNARITLEDIANIAGTTNEEVATSISALLPRVYIK